MTQALARATQSREMVITPEQINVIKRTVCPNVTEDQFFIFMHICKRTGLDPFSRQIYGIVRKSKNQSGGFENRLTIQTGIDGYRLIAHRSAGYAGQDDAEFGPDAQSDGITHPSWARVTVYKIINGIRVPFVATARWNEYRQMNPVWGKKDGKPVKVGSKLGEMWERMPYLMLSKCAEALALRKGFPAELAGIYTHEEVGQPLEAPLVSGEGPRELPAPRKESKAEAQKVVAAPTKKYPITEAHKVFGNELVKAFSGSKDEAANELERLTTWTDENGALHKGVRKIELCSLEVLKKAAEQFKKDIGGDETQDELPF